jgi:ATP-dependent Clp protease ATP-binding subunit ClpA
VEDTVKSSSVVRQILERRVVGQDTSAVVDAYTMWRAGLAGVDKPVAAFLLLGPTGCGKTCTAETLAWILHGNPATMIKVHCAEYRHSHEIARLIGSPPGYLGHRDTAPRLSAQKLAGARTAECGLAVLLFDEIEKAHADLWALLLGVLDKGELDLGDGSHVDLKQTILFFTSNVGSREAAGQVGFNRAPRLVAESAARSLFSPEFRNRITATIVYRELSTAALLEIADLELRKTADRLYEKRVALLTQGDVREAVVNECREEARTMGARTIRRVIERLIELPVAQLVEREVGQVQEVVVRAKAGQVTVGVGNAAEAGA